MNFFARLFGQKPKSSAAKKVRSSQQGQLRDDFKAFILEPILTPSALIDGGEDAPDPTVIDGGNWPFLDALDALETGEDEPDLVEVRAAIAEPEFLEVESGYFVVGESGEISVDFVFDGGKYKGEVALFSLRDMGEFDPESPEFIQEAARRALSDSDWGRVVISDRSEGAKLDGLLEARNWNRGEYQGEKTFSFQAGDRLGAMLVPNGSLQQVFDNPLVTGAKHPLFSMVTGNPDDSFDGTALVRVGDDGCGFAWEDLSLHRGSDRDYNDVVFRLEGAIQVEMPEIDDLMDGEREWREGETGEQILAELDCSRVGGDGEAPVLEVGLANDTGRSGEDGITFDGSIVGTVGDESGISQLRLSIDGTNFVEMTGDLGVDGSFALDGDRLEGLLGKSLAEGEQTLYFQATDEHGNASEIISLSLTLDRIAPEIELDLEIASDTGEIGDRTTELEIVTLTGRTEPHSFVVLTETGETVTADENGMFAFEDISLEVGENEFSVEATDVAGNTNTSEQSFTRIDPAITLIEENNFSVTHEQTVLVSEENSLLSFDLLDIVFDTTTPEGINDAFEVALLDAEGNSLVQAIGTERDAFFNLTEGLNADLAAGVTYEGQTITVDLGGIPVGTEATLQFRLANNDGDTTTTARIDKIEIVPREEPVEEPTVIPEIPFQGAGEIDLEALFDVSDSVALQHGQTSFNEGMQTLYTDVWLENIGDYVVDSPLLVTVTTEDPSVQVRDFDGITPEGIPYFDFTGLIAGGMLKKGERTSSRPIAFYTPLRKPFEYEITVIGAVNRSPEFVGEPDIEAVVGQLYETELVAVDEDGDNLTYQIVETPEGMDLAVDLDTGVVRLQWSPSLAQEGNHGVKVEVADGRGGTDELAFVLGAVEAQPNRPPLIRSTPVVDANANSEYVYQVVAEDPDGDSLTYVLSVPDGEEFPEDLTIDESGRIVWTPQGKHVGLHEVVVTVDDNKNGGKVEQRYTIRVQPEEGNHDPVIVSEPETRIARNPNSILEYLYQYDVDALEPDEDNLVYSLVDAPDGMAINADTGDITWEFVELPASAPVVTVKVVDERGGEDFQTYTIELNVSGTIRGTVIEDDPRGRIVVAHDVNTLAVNYVAEPEEKFAVNVAKWLTEENTGNLLLIESYPDNTRNYHPDVIQSLEDAGYTITIMDRTNYTSYTVEELQAFDGVFLGKMFQPIPPSSGFFDNETLVEYVNSGGNVYLYSGVDNASVLEAEGWKDFLNTFGLGYVPDNYNGILQDIRITGEHPIFEGITELASGNGQSLLDLEPDNPQNQIIQYYNHHGTEHGVYAVFDPDAGLEGWRVYLDIDDDGMRDPNEPHTLTDAEGNYSFMGLDAGDYLVRTESQPGWINTFPTEGSLELGNNLIQNGGFEERLIQDDGLKWDGDEGTIEVMREPFGQFRPEYLWQDDEIDGLHSIDLNNLSPNSIYQVIDTEINKEYLVEFSLSANPGGRSGNGYNSQGRPKLMEVSAIAPSNPNNTQSTKFAGISTGYSHEEMDYQRQSFRFTAKSDKTKIEFRSLFSSSDPFQNSYGPVIDRVSVSPILSESESKHDVTLGQGEIVSDIDFGKRKTGEEIPNRNPELTSNPVEVAGVGQLWEYQAFATDPDNDNLTYFLSVASEGMAVDPETGKFVWTPTLEQIGTHSVVIGVNDGNGGIDLQSFSITADINYAPAITSVPPTTNLNVGEPHEYRVLAQDANGDPLTFRVDHDDIDIDDNGILQWSNPILGEHSVTITVDDDRGGIDTQTITLTVDDSLANTPPQILSEPRKSIGFGRPYIYKVEAVDEEGDPLTYSIADSGLGMSIDENGWIYWTPTDIGHVGEHDIEIVVKDDKGGEATQTINLQVGGLHDNRDPKIVELPPNAAIAEEEYQHSIQGIDPDGDVIFWNLEEAPEGLSIHRETGVLHWIPTPEQVGDHEVTVKVSDLYGGEKEETFILTVRGTNNAPIIDSVPPTLGAVGKEYLYPIFASDPEGDEIAFIGENLPDGMLLDEETGVLSWTPTQTGSYEVSVRVKDELEAETTHTYTLQVEENVRNLPPVITSFPETYGATPDVEYRYQVTATDPEGENPTYTLVSQPDRTYGNIEIDSETGLLTWTPNEAAKSEGNHTIEIAAEDEQGLKGIQRFTLNVRENNAPIIDSTPSMEVTGGDLFRYDVKATDPDGDDLHYQLNNAPSGMAIDAEGRMVWETPANLNEIFDEIEVVVTDEYGATAVQTIPLQVNGDAEAPVVEIFQSLNFAYPKDEVTFAVRGTDNVGVEDISLTIDGDPVALDASGMVKWSFENVGTYTLLATATDKAGNIATQDLTFEVQGIPAGDEITLDIQALSEPIRDFTDLIGTVTAVNGLQSYKVEVAPVGSDTFIEVFSKSDNPAEVDNGILGEFDPTLLANGPYTLRLSAIDNNGATSAIETQIEVAGDLKLGNFQLSFTDLEMPVSGIPITVTRTYDSLYANEQDNFGYGWRLEFRDTNLQTNVPPPTPEEELLGRHNGFRDGTRVYITLPGGKRESFTFDPKPDRILGMAAGLAGQPASAFRPRFVAEDGSELTLTVNDVLLSYDSDTGRYFSANPLGLPYNPEDPRFGGKYTLTTKEGLEYEIDANTGDLLQVKDLNGNTLTYSDAGIVSSTGKEVKFERDAEGRIKTAIDPQGYEIKYEYDENGDLQKVIDRENNETEFFYEVENRPHYLTRIEDPLGRDGIRTEYDPDTGRLSELIDVNGQAVKLEYEPDQKRQIVRDVYDQPTIYLYDDNGNVETEIQPSGLRIERTYENNQIKTETFITEESGPDGWETVYEYDDKGNKIAETDPLGNTIRYTHNQYGQVLTVTDSLGNTVTSDYSPRGNLRSTDDGNGNVTKYSNDLNGNIHRLETGNNTIIFDYYGDGNVKNLEDDLGNKGEYKYTPNGDLEKEILTIQTPDGEEQIVTEWIYDQEGRLKTQIQGENRIDYDYDDNGNQIASIADGQTTQYRYDEKGQRVETIYPDDTTDPADNPRTITVYDKGGRERASIDRDGNVTHYEYDVMGRLTKTIYADDSTNQVEALIATIAPDQTIETIDWTEVLYPDETPSYLDTRAYSGTQYTQDGRVKAEFDSDGNSVSYKYDPIGRQTEIRYDEQNSVTYTYDKAGNRRTETYYAEGTQWSNTYDELGRLVSFKDPNNHVTQYEYDDNGQLKAVIDAKKGRTEYEYHEDGQLKSIKDALNQTTTYEYDDPEGRITKIILPDTSKETTYTYDDTENSVTVKDFNGEEIKYVYDEAGSLLRKDLLSLGTSVSYSYDEETRTETIVSARGTTVYQYDESGRLLSRQDPEGPYIDGDGASLEYVYDENRVTVKTSHREIVYEYNEDGTLKSVTTPEGTTAYRYEDGVLVKTIFPNGTAEVIVYDPLGRIDVIKTVKIDPDTEEELEVLASYDYEVDDAGNREEVIDHNGRKVEYEYDELNRVIEEKISNPLDASEDGRTITYVYDAVGNLDYKGDTVAGDTDFVYNSLNQLVKSIYNGEETIYTYDDNGSLDTQGVGDYSVDYDWENDGENRLQSVAIDDGGTRTNIEYEYNEQGIRTSKKVNGVETNYLIDELQPYAQVLEEYDALGNLQNAYVYGNDLVSQSDNDETLFYHVDSLGSTRVLTDESGNIKESYNYDAYGNLIIGDASENAYLFAGEQRDIETGLNYLRARYYDPTLGRFISRDAYQGDFNDPMSQHKYQYAHANPVVNTDPSGYATNLTELAALASMTAILGGLGITTGGAIGTALNGGSTSDVLSIYNQYVAGMMDGLTFGISTQARRLAHGNNATQNHKGLYFNLGRFGGGIATMWIGSYAASFSGLAKSSWWARAALGYDLFGAGAGIVQSTINIAKGQATWWDILPFLVLLPLIGVNLQLTSKGLRFKGAGQNVDISPSGINPTTPTAPNNNVRKFPNLRPDDIPNEIPSPNAIKEIFFDRTKWRYKNLHGKTFTPDGKYNFVVVEDRIFIAREMPSFGQHIDISRGRDVQFAGAIRFGKGKTTRGKIKYWDNGSGHYRPYADFANQAGLPIESFTPHVPRS